MVYAWGGTAGIRGGLGGTAGGIRGGRGGGTAGISAYATKRLRGHRTHFKGRGGTCSGRNRDVGVVS